MHSLIPAFSPRKTARNHGFSLVETLVATVVITAIAVVGTGTVQSALNKGAMVREMGSAKTLIGAYLQSANDNNGKFLPGYDRTVSEFNLPDGTVIAGPPAQRYPYRLASYFNYRMEGTVLVNKNTKQVSTKDTYRLSLYPAFGINYIFVGGDISSSGQYTFPGECVTIQSLASNSILVFATAASSASNPSGGESNGQISGYCILTPPNGMYPNWSSSKWNCKSSPDNYGNVDARYNNQAICAFLDGSVRLQSVEELRNMSLWSRNAAMQHNPNYMVPPPVRSGGRL